MGGVDRLHDISRAFHHPRKGDIAFVQLSYVHIPHELLLLPQIIVGYADQLRIHIAKPDQLFPKRPLPHKTFVIIVRSQIILRHIPHQASRLHLVRDTEHIIIGAVRIPCDLVQTELHIILDTVLLDHAKRHI